MRVFFSTPTSYNWTFISGTANRREKQFTLLGMHKTVKSFGGVGSGIYRGYTNIPEKNYKDFRLKRWIFEAISFARYNRFSKRQQVGQGPKLTNRLLHRLFPREEILLRFVVVWSVRLDWNKNASLQCNAISICIALSFYHQSMACKKRVLYSLFFASWGFITFFCILRFYYFFAGAPSVIGTAFFYDGISSHSHFPNHFPGAQCSLYPCGSWKTMPISNAFKAVPRCPPSILRHDSWQVADCVDWGVSWFCFHPTTLQEWKPPVVQSP